MSAVDAAQQAARLTDPVGHGWGLLGMIAGAIIGAVVGAILIAGAVATGGALLIALAVAGAGACVAGAGLSGGQLARGIQTAAGLSNPTHGVLAAPCSLNVIVGKLPAARAVADMAAACTGLFPPAHHWGGAIPFPPIAEGAQTVLFNNLYAARVTSKLVCGAEISKGCETVVIGGPTIRVLEVDDAEEMLQTGLTYLLYGSLAAAFILTIPFGAAAVAEFLIVGGLFVVGFEVLGEIGDAIGPGWRDILQGVFGLGTVIAGGVRTRGRIAERAAKPPTPKSEPPAKYSPGNLPKDPNKLLEAGWIDTTHPEMKANTSSREFTDPETGTRVRFDPAKPGANGWEGKDHYHVDNPNATGKGNRYLDKDGNPVPKGSNKSHIEGKD